MKITGIEKSKGDRYTVFVDGEYWYILVAEIIVFNHIKVGKEVDEDFLSDIKMQAEQRKARERAYYLLEHRDHSKKELYDKLLKSVSPQVAAQTVKLMEEQGFLDDEAYAQKLLDYYMSTKNWGARRAYCEMLKKGIDKEIASAALEEIKVDYVEKILGVIEKKYYYCLDDYKSQQKAIAALLRLGFSYDDIKLAISIYKERECE